MRDWYNEPELEATPPTGWSGDVPVASVAPKKGRPRGTYNQALDGAVRYAAACRAEGMSFEEVAGALVAQGYENARGGVSWSKQGVASLLKCLERGLEP